MGVSFSPCELARPTFYRGDRLRVGDAVHAGMEALVEDHCVVGDLQRRVEELRRRARDARHLGFRGLRLGARVDADDFAAATFSDGAHDQPGVRGTGDAAYDQGVEEDAQLGFLRGQLDDKVREA